MMGTAGDYYGSAGNYRDFRGRYHSSRSYRYIGWQLIYMEMDMICDEHCDGYIKSLIPDLDGYLEGIEEEIQLIMGFR